MINDHFDTTYYISCTFSPLHFQWLVTLLLYSKLKSDIPMYILVRTEQLLTVIFFIIYIFIYKNTIINSLHANVWKLKYLEGIFRMYRYLYFRAQRESYIMYTLYTWWYYEDIGLYINGLTMICRMMLTQSRLGVTQYVSKYNL